MIKLRIPATSANIGPGFDTFGIAFDLYNDFSFTRSDQTRISGCPLEYRTSDNLALVAFDHAMEALGQPQQSVHIEFNSNIPIARGLGSSSTCILAGILAANHYAHANLSNAQILDMALTFEGHPDNLSPALYGGMTVSIMEDEHVISEPIALDPELRFVAFIPNFPLSTDVARSVLPKSLSYKQSIYNTSRAGLLIAALINRHHHLLKRACGDALHQPFRQPLIKGYDKIFEIAYQQGAYAAFLSGAGPTIIAIFNQRLLGPKTFAKALPIEWQANILSVCMTGATTLGEDHDRR